MSTFFFFFFLFIRIVFFSQACYYIFTHFIFGQLHIIFACIPKNSNILKHPIGDIIRSQKSCSKGISGTKWAFFWGLDMNFLSYEFVKCSECALFFLTKLICNLSLFNRNTQKILKEQRNWLSPVYRYTLSLFKISYVLACLIDLAIWDVVYTS